MIAVIFEVEPREGKKDDYLDAAASLRPLLEHLNAIGRDASRAATLATAQVERADRLFADVALRIEQILSLIQSVVSGPLREGVAMMSALRAILNFMRDTRAGRRTSAEDEDALFV